MMYWGFLWAMRFSSRLWRRISVGAAGPPIAAEHGASSEPRELPLPAVERPLGRPLMRYSAPEPPECTRFNLALRDAITFLVSPPAQERTTRTKSYSERQDRQRCPHFMSKEHLASCTSFRATDVHRHDMMESAICWHQEELCASFLRCTETSDRTALLYCRSSRSRGHSCAR